jgi:hypothetical protein
MMARFPTLVPSQAIPPAPVSDKTWGTPYDPANPPPPAPPLPCGTYTQDGMVRGSATVVITDDSCDPMIPPKRIMSIAVTYHNFSDNGPQVINGTESVQRTSNSVLGCPSANSSIFNCVTWNENLTLSGQRTGTKVTSPGGFTVGPSLLLGNDFEAIGTMTTTIDGQTYNQPANGN